MVKYIPRRADTLFTSAALSAGIEGIIVPLTMPLPFKGGIIVPLRGLQGCFEHGTSLPRPDKCDVSVIEEEYFFT